MVSVTDGDTVELAALGKTRLIGVDTPEVYGGRECYGPEASAFTKRLLTSAGRVAYRLGAEPRDRYGRALAYVWLPDGRLVNALLVERGYATPLAIAPNTRLAPSFAAAARRARRARVGLWARRGCYRGASGGRRSRDAPRDRRAPGSTGADRDCFDFASRAQAQAYFGRRGGRPGRDVDGLDSDGDGRACETLR